MLETNLSDSVVASLFCGPIPVTFYDFVLKTNPFTDLETWLSMVRDSRDEAVFEKMVHALILTTKVDAQATGNSPPNHP